MNCELNTLLRKNTSPARIVGFLLSNFIGLTIITVALQFYLDSRSIFADDSFVNTDYIVVNKRVTGRNTLGIEGNSFSATDIADIEQQPWVRSVGRFQASDYHVDAAVTAGGRGMRTQMFFEAIPDRFVDVPPSNWSWHPGDNTVPIVISKDYLTLYNFGFAQGAGLPQLSEGLMSGIPLELTLTSDDGARTIRTYGRIAGYSNRLNTILVPENFMAYANQELGSGKEILPSRLIIDVSSPGDVAIAPYLDDHGLEQAGDKSASQASFLLRLVTGIILGIGALITVLSLSILLLSVSLIMERNRPAIHGLLMLGYNTGRVGRPYMTLVTGVSVISMIAAIAVTGVVRGYYLTPLEALGSTPGAIWIAPLAAILLTALTVTTNLLSIRRQVRRAW